MRNTDIGYRTNSLYHSDTNINGACTNGTKPRYLGGPGTYGSVSYKWGCGTRVVSVGVSPPTPEDPCGLALSSSWGWQQAPVD
jgi:hypothetical protein